MQVNFLEELVAEWFEYSGYIVKRNERVGRRSEGGYAGELDVVAFNPTKNHLIHIETSTDAASWATRESRFLRKFTVGAQYISTLFTGLPIPGPNEIEKRAIFAFGSDRKHKTIGGGKVQLAEDFILDVLGSLKQTSILSNAVPEKYTILRTLQMITEHRAKVVKRLSEL